MPAKNQTASKAYLNRRSKLGQFLDVQPNEKPSTAKLTFAQKPNIARKNSSNWTHSSSPASAPKNDARSDTKTDNLTPKLFGQGGKVSKSGGLKARMALWNDRADAHQV